MGINEIVNLIQECIRRRYEEQDLNNKIGVQIALFQNLLQSAKGNPTKEQYALGQFEKGSQAYDDIFEYFTKKDFPILTLPEGSLEQQLEYIIEICQKLSGIDEQ